MINKIYDKEKKNENNGESKEEDTMAATVKNYVYEVRANEGKKLMNQQPVSKAFLDECKRVAQKYRRKR